MAIRDLRYGLRFALAIVKIAPTEPFTLYLTTTSNLGAYFYFDNSFRI
jgi:hypothetical protein